MHYLYRHVQPMSVMAGWAGSDPVRREGHQRHGASGGPTGSAFARPSGGRLALLGCFTPLRQSPVERFWPWGAARLQRSSRRRRIPAPLPKEDCSVLAYRHEPPCGKGLTNPAGSGAHGASTTPKTSPPSLWHEVSTTLRRHRAAAAAAEAAALAGRKGESGRWQTG